MFLRLSLSGAAPLFALFLLVAAGPARAVSLPIPACEAFAAGLLPGKGANLEAHASWQRPLANTITQYAGHLRGIADEELRRAREMARSDHREEGTPGPGIELLAALAKETNRFAAQVVLAQDPYFRWLEENQAPVEPTGTRFQPHWPEPGAASFPAITREPLALCAAHIATNSINRLRPELALARIMRDFDPSLADDTRARLDRVLSLERQIVTALYLSRQVQAFNHPLVWRAATSLDKALEALEMLETLIISHFGRLFPHPHWLRLMRAFEQDDPAVIGAVTAVHAFLAEGTQINGNRAINSVRILVEYLEMPTAASLDTLQNALSLPPKVGESYPAFLLRMFPNEIRQGFASDGILGLYNGLRWLVELGEAAEGRAFDRHLEREARRLNFSY